MAKSAETVSTLCRTTEVISFHSSELSAMPSDDFIYLWSRI